MGSVPESGHFILFPFLSQGHIIPLLSLARLLRRRCAAITVCTTPGNAAAVKTSLMGTDIRVIEFPFPQNIEGVPPGVENTHKLASMDAFINFARATKSMQESFENALETLDPPPAAVISDFFLGWTLESAVKYGVPRYVFTGMGQFSYTMYNIIEPEKNHRRGSLDDPFSMPDFPEIMMCLNDFDPSVYTEGAYMEFIVEQKTATAASQGILVNSFYELEGVYVDYWNQKFGPRALCAGPLSEAVRGLQSPAPTGQHAEFLDERLESQQPVLYVAFGTQAHVPPEQIEEIAEGLDKSGVSFLWTLRSKDEKFIENFQRKVKGRGMVSTDWVDQISILQHSGVKGFFSHCGWNSVMESIASGVPILAMPFMAEQHMNAKFVAEVAGVGLRAMPVGSVRGLVSAEEITRKVRQLMIGEEGAEVRRRSAELGRTAQKAAGEGGSSHLSLDSFVAEINGREAVGSARLGSA